MRKYCKVCGCDLERNFPELKDDWSICPPCMVEYCCQTNCWGCSYGDYPNCQFLEMKKSHMKDIWEGGE